MIEFIKRLKSAQLVVLVFIVTSCVRNEPNMRYQAVTNDNGSIIVVDQISSEVFIYYSDKSLWVSLGKPNETTFNRSNYPK